MCKSNCPSKKIKEIPKEIAPWFDEELEEKMRIRDYFHSKIINSTASLESSEIFSKFKQHKAEFQRIKREKQKEHFTSKNIYDFKNNKLFWDHYSPFIKIKSDETVDFSSTVFFMMRESLITQKRLVKYLTHFLLIFRQHLFPVKKKVKTILTKFS